MRILEPFTILSILTIGTCLSWRRWSEQVPGARARIMQVGLVLCTLNTVLAYVFYWRVASIYGLHRTASQFSEHDYAVVKVIMQLSFVGFITSLLTGLCAIAGKPGTARRWCLGIGIVMTLIWFGENFGFGDVLVVGEAIKHAR